MNGAEAMNLDSSLTQQAGNLVVVDFDIMMYNEEHSFAFNVWYSRHFQTRRTHYTSLEYVYEVDDETLQKLEECNYMFSNNLSDKHVVGVLKGFVPIYSVSSNNENKTYGTNFYDSDLSLTFKLLERLSSQKQYKRIVRFSRYKSTTSLTRIVYTYKDSDEIIDMRSKLCVAAADGAGGTKPWRIDEWVNGKPRTAVASGEFDYYFFIKYTVGRREIDPETCQPLSEFKIAENDLAASNAELLETKETINQNAPDELHDFLSQVALKPLDAKLEVASRVRGSAKSYVVKCMFFGTRGLKIAVASTAEEAVEKARQFASRLLELGRLYCFQKKLKTGEELVAGDLHADVEAPRGPFNIVAGWPVSLRKRMGSNDSTSVKTILAGKAVFNVSYEHVPAGELPKIDAAAAEMLDSLLDDSKVVRLVEHVEPEVLKKAIKYWTRVLNEHEEEEEVIQTFDEPEDNWDDLVDASISNALDVAYGEHSHIRERLNRQVNLRFSTPRFAQVSFQSTPDDFTTKHQNGITMIIDIYCQKSNGWDAKHFRDACKWHIKNFVEDVNAIFQHNLDKVPILSQYKFNVETAYKTAVKQLDEQDPLYVYVLDWAGEEDGMKGDFTKDDSYSTRYFGNCLAKPGETIKDRSVKIQKYTKQQKAAGQRIKLDQHDAAVVGRGTPTMSFTVKLNAFQCD